LPSWLVRLSPNSGRSPIQRVDFSVVLPGTQIEGIEPTVDERSNAFRGEALVAQCKSEFSQQRKPEFPQQFKSEFSRQTKEQTGLQDLPRAR
jgi:hypothetical protein